jgi:hypothetical protein
MVFGGWLGGGRGFVARTDRSLLDVGRARRSGRPVNTGNFMMGIGL